MIRFEPDSNSGADLEFDPGALVVGSFLSEEDEERILAALEVPGEPDEDSGVSLLESLIKPSGQDAD